MTCAAIRQLPTRALDSASNLYNNKIARSVGHPDAKASEWRGRAIKNAEEGGFVTRHGLVPLQTLFSGVVGLGEGLVKSAKLATVEVAKKAYSLELKGSLLALKDSVVTAVKTVFSTLLTTALSVASVLFPKTAANILHKPEVVVAPQVDVAEEAAETQGTESQEESRRSSEVSHGSDTSQASEAAEETELAAEAQKTERRHSARVAEERIHEQQHPRTLGVARTPKH